MTLRERMLEIFKSHKHVNIPPCFLSFKYFNRFTYTSVATSKRRISMACYSMVDNRPLKTNK